MEDFLSQLPINQQKPTEVFVDEEAEQYEERIDALWHNLVHANASMFVINHVIQFPRGVLLSPTH